MEFELYCVLSSSFFSASVHILSTNNNNSDKKIRCSVHVSAVLLGETLNLLLPVLPTRHHPPPPNLTMSLRASSFLQRQEQAAIGPQY